MAAPNTNYMKLTNGRSDTHSTISTNALIKTGDIIRISGTANNNLLFYVSSAYIDGDDVYYLLKGAKGITNESSNTNLDIQIDVTRTTGDKLCALGDVDTGEIDVWSDNASSSYGTTDNGWETKAINPTLDGSASKYIYHFADEALRVCDTNKDNSSLIKWYGYIQRQQFNLKEGLSFIEWQEHPNNLARPKIASTFSYAFAGDFHANNAANYYKTIGSSPNKIRGVANIKTDTVSALRLDEEHEADVIDFSFENTSGTDVNDLAVVGEVITIDTALGVEPKEFLFCKKEAGQSATMTYSRRYGATGSSVSAVDFGDEDSSIIERGLGFNLGISAVDGVSGDWEEGSYTFLQSFIYDENQESLLSLMGNGTADTIFTHVCAGQEVWRLSVFADVAYNARITGGRIYTQLAGSSEEPILLVDINIVKGVRYTLDGDYEPWSHEVGDGFFVLGNTLGSSFKPNLDTYTTINGFGADNTFVAIGGLGESYQSSVVANRRTFIANVKTRGKSGEVDSFGDRIMFSEIGKYDTFLDTNFIDVSKGDYGEYTAIESYSDRILAFKNHLVHVINISSPSISNWYLEETIKNAGVNFNFSVVKTIHGIAWATDSGCYLYNGDSVTNLLDDKLSLVSPSYDISSLSSWETFYRGSATIKDVMIGFEPTGNSLIILRSPDDKTSNSNKVFMYNFDTKSWTYNVGMFDDSETYTNFIIDWNNNLTLGQDVSNTVQFKKVLPVPLNQQAQEFVTRDIDFGQPGLIKKVYKVIVTYISDAAETTPFKYAIDGKQNFAGDGGGTFVGNFASTSGKWDVLTLTVPSPIECQSLQIKFDAPTTGIFEINDMTIEYRTLSNRNVT